MHASPTAFLVGLFLFQTGLSKLSWRSTQPFLKLGDHIGRFSYHGKLLFGAFLCGTSVQRFGPYGFGSSHAKSKAVTSMVVRKNNCLMQGDRAQSIHVKAFTSKVPHCV